MARWRLLNPHYLKVPGTEWEYTEVSRETGKQARVRYPVGLLLNPNDSADHNFPGEIIVAHARADGSKYHRNDIVFEGPPTPDMEPVDEEAEKISEEWRAKWAHPIDSLPGYGDYSQSLLTQFDKELTEAIRRVGGVPKGENVSVKAEDFEDLKKQVATLTKQNALLLGKLTQRGMKDANPGGVD